MIGIVVVAHAFTVRLGILKEKTWMIWHDVSPNEHHRVHTGNLHVVVDIIHLEVNAANDQVLPLYGSSIFC